MGKEKWEVLLALTSFVLIYTSCKNEKLKWKREWERGERMITLGYRRKFKAEEQAQIFVPPLKSWPSSFLEAGRLLHAVGHLWNIAPCWVFIRKNKHQPSFLMCKMQNTTCASECCENGMIGLMWMCPSTGLTQRTCFSNGKARGRPRAPSGKGWWAPRPEVLLASPETASAGAPPWRRHTLSGVAHTLERQEYKGLTFWVQFRTTSMGCLVKLLPVGLA